jgi:putative membrane protein
VKVKVGVGLAFSLKVVLLAPMASTTELLSRSVAGMNALATVFLLIGFAKIKAGDRAGHGKAMGAAVLISALFLALYLASKVHLWVALGRTNILYRPEVGLTWDKLLYYVILFPHILLAILVTPFIIRAVWLAKQGRFEDHKRLTRWVFPVWLYVSVTGVIVWAFMEFSGSLAAAAQLPTK